MSQLRDIAAFLQCPADTNLALAEGNLIDFDESLAIDQPDLEPIDSHHLSLFDSELMNDLSDFFQANNDEMLESIDRSLDADDLAASNPINQRLFLNQFSLTPVITGENFSGQSQNPFSLSWLDNEMMAETFDIDELAAFFENSLTLDVEDNGAEMQQLFDYDEAVTVNQANWSIVELTDNSDTE